MLRQFALALLVLVGLPVVASGVHAQQMTSPAGASVSITNIKDGDTVKSPFKVEFGVTGMTIAKAGTMEPNTGHHHLLIDAPFDPADAAKPIPNDAHHMHFGAGQTEATVTLPPGKHTLQLVLGDGRHIPHNPPVISQPITVNVE